MPEGAWLLQTAAGSTLGRMLIALAKLRGVRTINVVRRGAQAQDLLASGAPVVWLGYSQPACPDAPLSIATCICHLCMMSLSPCMAHTACPIC